MKQFIVLIVLLSSFAIAQAAYPYVVIETTAGSMTVKLYDDTPLHSENFIELVSKGYYNNQLFHRVIDQFMIQAGDPNSITAKPGQVLGNGGPGYTIPPEFVKTHYHKKGALAAARQGDNINPGKESSGSQFYIVQGRVIPEAQLTAFEQQYHHPPFTDEQKQIYTTLGGTPHLDYEYTVFGEVVNGLDILDLIAAQPVDPSKRPIDDIRIIKMYLKK